jgi:hypothetical protein
MGMGGVLGDGGAARARAPPVEVHGDDWYGRRLRSRG